MTSVVQSSSSIYSTYISTIDHLPCDIIRSLWLVQSCNTFAENEKQKLSEILEQISSQSSNIMSQDVKESIARQYTKLRARILENNKEAIAELEALHSQLLLHQTELDQTVAKIETSESERPLTDLIDQKKLRAQLKRHYEKNPLPSQVEALQERQLSANVIVRQVKGLEGDLKIIFKIPKLVNKKLRKSHHNEESPSNKREKDHAFDEASSLRELGRSKNKRSTSSEMKNENLRQENEGNRGDRTVDYKKVKEDHSAGVIGSKSRKSAEKGMEEPETEQYCFCKQPSFGDMIACDNSNCPNGEWFHYKCVGLLNKVEARKYTKQKWFCSDSCRIENEELQRKQKLKQSKKKRRHW